LQAEGDFFKGMGHAGGLPWACAFEGANCWKNAAQFFFKIVAWQHFAFFWGAANDGFNAGLTTP
jgi:hypothetical protein